LPQCEKKRQRSRTIFAAPEIISFAGQQNPTGGTWRLLGGIRRMENAHEINVLHGTVAFGTAIAKRLPVVEFTTRPYYIQIPLSSL
jgi:hypothetical protein